MIFNLMKKVLKGEASPVELIQGENKPSIILVDLICTKILCNLDNIAFEEVLYDNKDGSAMFSWKVDDILVAGTRVYKVTQSYDREKGTATNYRKPKLDYFSVAPQIKVHGEKYEITKDEQERLWETMLKAGRMKIVRDKERAEYNRQRLAVEAIANMGGRESDVVKRAKELSEQALLRLAPPDKSAEEKLEERINSVAD